MFLYRLRKDFRKIGKKKLFLNPDGAAILIESLSKITENESLKIDTQELRKQGATLRSKMEKIIQSYAGQQQQEQGQTPKSMREGIMYG